jgi:hypothetical protein
LSGRFSRFGRQAAAALQAWESLDGTVDLVVEDDCSDRSTLETLLPSVAARCDLLLGPYSTLLMRAAGRIAAEKEWLIWNHGGSGDDVEQAHPGHVVSVLTPTSKYAEPFLRYLAADGTTAHELLCIVQGPGSFGRQVASGAVAMASQLGIQAVLVGPDDVPPSGFQSDWNLFSAGVFEQDTETVSNALRLPARPRQVCTVAAGVREFSQVVDDPEGVFGIAQWFPGSRNSVLLGPDEDTFVRAFVKSASTEPDYPAIQAAAGAILAVHCVGLANGTRPGDLWAAAATLDTSTLFGGFRIDSTGRQVKHETVLIQWRNHEPVAVSGSRSNHC